MAKGSKLECVHCGRVFGMPAHLGRHLSAVHGAGKARGRRKATVGRRGRRPGRVMANGTGVANEIQRVRDALLSRRATLDSQIEMLDKVLDSLS